ncbi:hypothetical protein BKA65DRAFT_466068 [Rhexocercosporidium sp. MPI-PUGE-AT-0058]|nr:hypothetical protein BKA65DRAFT_466068 [Rhexocercosporidium sp. MPI-PUGE-AT-0058]
MPDKTANKPRVKVWKPKVRTGCRTCRTRHLKCDETRPSCLRCVKMGFDCDGYPKPKPAPVEPRGLAPRDLKDLVPKAFSLAPSPECTLSNFQFQNQQEYLSFQTFHERSMFELVGTGPWDLWDRIVLQACEYQGSIRNAVLAIGALSCTLDSNRASEEQQLFGLVGGSVQKDADRHEFALQKYGCAIGQMRRDIEKGQYGLRTTLICCTLVVCFELFEGNHTSALAHATTGLELLNERNNGRKKDSATSQQGRFEDSLGEIFMRFNRTARPFALESLFEAQDNFIDELEETLPEVFISCTEARRAWTRTVRMISESMGLRQSRDRGLGERSRRRAASHTPSSGSEDSEEEEAWQVDLVFARVRRGRLYPQEGLEQLLKWYTSFQPLFNSSSVSGDTHFRAEAAYLQAHHHINLIALRCAPWDNELQYDHFTPLFQEIIHLSQEILVEQKSPTSHRPVFTFDTGVVGFLWVVATKCRDSATRWQAVRLMLDSPSREGRWHSAFVAKGAEAIIRIEELGVRDMRIPEEARIKAEGVTFELVTRKGILTYSRLPRSGEFGFGKRLREKIEVIW